jgi:hypothetical protein
MDVGDDGEMLPLALLVACADTGSATLTVTLDPDMPLRATARWEVPQPVRAWVRYGEDRATAPTDATEATLLGLPAGEPVTAALVTEQGVLAEVEVAPGEIDDRVPRLTVEGDGFGAGYLVTTVAGGDGRDPMALALDGRGRVAWYAPLEPYLPVAPDSAATRSPTPWALRAVDGGVLLSLTPWNAGLVVVPFEGGSVTQVALDGAHHDLELLPDGTLAYTRAVTREVDGEPVTGDQLVVRSRDGTTRQVWDAFGTLPVTRHDGWNGMPGVTGDWTHANGIGWNPSTGQWAVSLFWLHQIVIVDDATGQVVRILDGDTLPAGFGPQHCVTWADGGWWTFDNGNGATGSSALHLADDGTLLERWTPSSVEWSPVIGDVTPFGDGQLAVSMGAVPRLHVVDAERAEVLQVRVEAGATVLGQVAWVPSLAPTRP